ncbi:MAG: hypothetical protein OXC28_12050 [Defluviicoccus sp.]|nr:hypothetical protein [Defluviicoccus sp.]
MTEKEWTKRIAHCLQEALSRTRYGSCKIEVGKRIPYEYEIRSYNQDDRDSKINAYQTDLAILEFQNDGSWIPRVVVEVKMDGVHTHDAITYSQKALSHKTVHPYLRYGIILADRKNRPLPGRFYRHGAHFDFMMSFVGTRPKEAKAKKFSKLIRAEIDASRILEKIIYENRMRDRDCHTFLHKALRLE